MFMEGEMFFNAENGCSYPLTAVDRVRKIRARNVAMVAIREEEFEVNLTYWERAIEGRPVALTVAQPETYLLEAVGTDDGDCYEKISVVAWASLMNGDIVPVTPEGADDRSRPVLLPDGKVIEPENMSHESLSDFLTHHETKLWEKAA